MNKKTIPKPNPYETANLISKLLFWWILPLIWKGYRRQILNVKDLFRPLKEDESKKLGDQLERAWAKEIETAKTRSRKPKLLKALFSVFGVKYILYSSISAFAECGIRVGQIMLLKYVVASFNPNEVDQDSDTKMLKQYLYTAGFCMSGFLWILVQFHAIFEVRHMGMKWRLAISSMIYRKALRLSQASNNQTTIGQLVNLLSNDVAKFDLGLYLTPYIIIGPLQMLILSVLIWMEIGYSCLGGIGLILLLIPTKIYGGTKLARLGREIAKRTDERGRLMNEIIIAMRVIKMYAWEKPFSKIVDSVRRFQVEILRKAASSRGVHESLYTASAKLVPSLTLLIYHFSTENTLTAEQVYFMVTVFISVRRNVAQGFLPARDILVALDRIESLLLLEEHKVPAIKLLPNSNVNSESKCYASLVMNNVCASWPSVDKDKLTLNRVSTNIHGDLLVMIVGEVGSGKTSLLNTIINELPTSSGTFELHGSTSYATQEPWIFTGSLKENILLGLDYNETRYKEVIEVCALEDDLKQLPFGDNTIVGERGVALSGGQKARVNLARALYREADIYLLDDPLSAVDAKVSRHIFDKCVKKHLQGKLRILVTHQLQYLPQADHILVINQGHVLAQGSYKELIKNGIDFMYFITTTDTEEQERKHSVINSEKSVELPLPAELEEGQIDQKLEKHTEKMIIGQVGLKLYWKYFKSGGSILQTILIVLGFVLIELICMFSDVWLAAGINAEEREAKRHSTSSKLDSNIVRQDLHIYVFSGLAVLIFVLGLGHAVFFFTYCTKIGIKLHDRMFQSLIRAPTKFFDNNPAGRVMNRFTKDIGSIDQNLPTTMFDAVPIIFAAFGSITIVCVSNYILIAPSVILIAVLLFLRKLYIPTASSVKKIESVARSPMFTHLAYSIQGLSTIRASNAQEILIEQFDSYQDLHSSAWYIFLTSSRWFAMWLEIACVAFLAAVSIIFILLGDNSVGGNVGLAISSIMGLSGVLKYGINQATETENLMTSFERVLEYVKLEPEAPLDSLPGKKPPSNWPANGSIIFRNVCVAYDDKDVLKNLTFEIKAREKIGIVGRTGAGKSSIIAALFRMTEPRIGEMYIDGVCLNNIGLHDLRKNISIIPQDPVLFSGTIRHNLDPFNQFNDVDLWKVLDDVELKGTVNSLDFKVSDGGSNFSVGEKQLLCLGRAILRRNKIMVMDEATANVDPRTDNCIQKTIRTKFADCTIITIAHRLQSVMDCDKILVMDNGHLKEYDHPFVLLQTSQGYLSSMIAQTGKESAALLRQFAKESYSGERDFSFVKNIKTLETSGDDVQTNEHDQ